ncbi:MAG TPA: hypothetical protein VGM19_02265 [Armatimonadota bacterium]|jgi:uncharacterized membrane-anchored protein
MDPRDLPHPEFLVYFLLALLGGLALYGLFFRHGVHRVTRSRRALAWFWMIVLILSALPYLIALAIRLQ